MPILGTISSGISGNLAVPAWDSIATATMNNNNSVSFNNIPQTYQHLHLRMRAQVSYTASPDWWRVKLQVNGNDVTFVQLFEFADSPSGATAVQYTSGSGGGGAGYIPGNSSGLSNYKGVSMIDIPNYTRTGSVKTAQMLGGQNLTPELGSTYNGLGSLIYGNVTGAITNVTFYVSGVDFVNSTFHLYGIKG